ncbi:MAG TPA: Glu/Leu/Phe/Val dehydrogenase dimerization domain-containing protein [Bryobacteraceae bacterium]|nr:Glu/Leu/Phe/Val dehydrogenase dimerization domain-containing protein [Bryobacteraceae bacterium]
MRLIHVQESSRLVGFIAIDSTIAGRACGGLRMSADVSTGELALLARAMTLKYGLLGLPQGGAKAGIISDPEAPEGQRLQALTTWARGAIVQLRSREYVPAPDMGTDNAAIRKVLQAAGVPPARRELQGERSGFYTALGVFLALESAAERLGKRLEGLTAIIEGFGKVGASVAGLLAQAGVRIVGASNSGGAIYGGPFPAAAIQDLLRSPQLSPPELLERPADILIPCARHHSIHARNWPRVQAGIITPGANCPVTAGAERALIARGVFVFPDFVANCGGVLGGTMEFAGVAGRHIESFFRNELKARLVRLLADAGGAAALRECATATALDRFAAVKQAAEFPSIASRAFGAGVALYRNGWLPRAAAAPLALRYFARRVAK